MNIYNELDTFFQENTLYIVIGVISLIIIVLLIFLLGSLAKKKKSIVSETTNPLIEALGGQDNLIETSSRGSRLIVKLNNYDIVDKDRLLAMNIKFIQMSDKLTLVIGKDAEQLAKALLKK